MKGIMRLQLALNVRNIDEAICFYTKMFGTGPAKTKPGYANFAIENPPLKLVLFEAAGGVNFEHLNHLGVEVQSAAEVAAAEARIAASGIETTGVDTAACCFAKKTETWVASRDNVRWEWYVKTGDTEQMEHVAVNTAGVCSG